MLGDNPHTDAGPWRAESGGYGGPCPLDRGVYHPVRRRHASRRPPHHLRGGTSSGYHHLGDLYVAYHRVVGERALKERAPIRKGIPGLRAWLAYHSGVLVPVLREPTPRWQAAPKD